MKKIFILFLSFFSMVILKAQNGKQPILLTDMLKMKTAGNLVANNSGTMAAFTVTSIEPDEKKEGDYKYLTQIYKVDLTANATPVQLTFSKESSTQPAWSPDGKTLAFVRVADAKPQIFLLPMSGGEAYQLTKFTYGASAPKWSPDGKKILFAASIQMKDYLRDSVVNPNRSLAKWPLEKPGVTDFGEA